MPIDESKLDAIVANEVAEKEQIRTFLITNKGKNREIDVEGMKLLVPSVIPKKIRHELAKIQRKGDVDIEDAEQDTYYLLSILCQNEPYNHKEVWEYIDDETGKAIDILGVVLEEGYQSEQKVKNFRGK
jgi:hypothetical protein